MTLASGKRASARSRPPLGRLRRARRRGQAGQSLVEFTLALPILIIVLLIGVDFGRLFFSYLQITNAAREGANYGIKNPDDSSGITSRVAQEANVQTQQNGSAGAISVATTCSPDSCLAAKTNTNQNVVKVTVSRTFWFFTPGISNLFGNLTLTASASSVAIGLVGQPVTAPPCTTVPNVVGLTPAAANTAIIGAGMVPNGTDNAPPGGSVLSQSPAAGSCAPGSGTVVAYAY